VTKFDQAMKKEEPDWLEPEDPLLPTQLAEQAGYAVGQQVDKMQPRDNKWLMVVGAVLLLIFWPLGLAVIGFALWLQYFRKPGLK
jgi:hypothetical protein